MTTTINASTSSGLVATPDNSGAIALQSNGTNIVTINSSGLTFNNPSSSSPTALYDYQQGTWTPTITSGSGTITTYSVSGAKYTKIGNVCTATVAIFVTTPGTAGGTLNFTLPFTGTNTIQIGGWGMEVNTNGAMLKGYLPSSGVTMQITLYNNSSPFTTGGGSNYIMNVVYQTA
jgi:hypothetical protein